MNNFLFEPPKFLDPERTLFAAGLASGSSLIDLGAGSGFYVLAAAKIVGDQGSVSAVDILDTALDHIAAEARVKNFRNIQLIKCNLEDPSPCTKVGTGTQDFVLLANIAHQIQNQAGLFAEAYRLLKTGGKLIALEWNDQPTPIGPTAQARVSLEAMRKLAKDATFKEAGTLPTDNYHYGLMFIK